MTVRVEKRRGAGWRRGGVGGGASAGFTLVEVILAIGIATGILIVALVFYNQAAHLRSQLIDEAERLSAVRLVMDRIAGDLRTAFGQPQVGFTGTSDSMIFVTARAPDLGNLQPGAASGASLTWSGADLAAGAGAGAGAGGNSAGASAGASRPAMNEAMPATVPPTDLRRLSYFLTAKLEGTNFVVTGLDRTDEPLVGPPPAPSPTPAPAASGSAPGGVTPSAAPGSGAALAAPAAAEPLAEMVRFARFRYWDGTEWLEAWDAPDLPPAVEVSLGFEPLPEGDLPDAYPYEVFRRVIVLPGSRPATDDWWAGL